MSNFFYLNPHTLREKKHRLKVKSSPLKLTERMYWRSIRPSTGSILSQTPMEPGHRSRCMLCKAWAMAYTASITNWTLPSCSYWESRLILSSPDGWQKCQNWKRQTCAQTFSRTSMYMKLYLPVHFLLPSSYLMPGRVSLHLKSSSQNSANQMFLLLFSRDLVWKYWSNPQIVSQSRLYWMVHENAMHVSSELRLLSAHQ